MRKRAVEGDPKAQGKWKELMEPLKQLQERQKAFQACDEGQLCKRLEAARDELRRKHPDQKGYGLIDDIIDKSKLLERFRVFEGPRAQECEKICRERLDELKRYEEALVADDYRGLHTRRLTAREAFYAAVKDLPGGEILTPELAETISAFADAIVLCMRSEFPSRTRFPEFYKYFSAVDLHPNEGQCAHVQRKNMRRAYELRELECDGGTLHKLQKALAKFGDEQRRQALRAELNSFDPDAAEGSGMSDSDDFAPPKPPASLGLLPESESGAEGSAASL